MKPQSAKAKGRRLQQEVRERILTAFPELDNDDVRSTSMGAGGEDLLLSPAARKLFPFSVECKNSERLNIWGALTQAEANCPAHVIPLVVFTRNRTARYAALPLNELLALCRRANG